MHSAGESVLVERFAQALDDEDYPVAASLLAADAEYNTGDTIVRGRDAIIESFRLAAESGRRQFDSVEFLHDISPDEPRSIRFLDVLTLNSRSFTLDHTMQLTISESGAITALALTYPPGERERLRAFLQSLPPRP